MNLREIRLLGSLTSDSWYDKDITNMVTNIVLIGILFLNILLLLGLLYCYQKVVTISHAVVDFITPQSEGQPSKLALVGERFGDMVARSLTAQIKSTFMGKQSGDVRALKAVEGDIAVDMANNSSLGGILQAFPTLSKSLRRNPQLFDLAMGVLSSKFKGVGGNGGNSKVTSSSPKFNF